MSPEANHDTTKYQNIRDKIEQIWLRARANAFAHRFAAEEYQLKASRYFVHQLYSGIFSILFVLFAYITTTYDATQFYQLPLAFTVLSVVAAAYGLIQSVMQNYFGYEYKCQLHNHNQHSFLYIAQRAREVDWPDIDLDKAIAILEDLERDFQVLKARGLEPNNDQFEKGNELLEKLRSGSVSEMQSFEGVPPDGKNADGNSSSIVVGKKG